MTWVLITRKPLLCIMTTKGVIHIATNPTYLEKVKHIELDCHLIRWKVQNKIIKIRYVENK